MDQVTEVLSHIDSISDDEMLETVANDHDEVGTPEVDIPEMRYLAAKMMKHPDKEVRAIAATLERCVERLEAGR